jgi:hypothetical protein
MKKYSISLIIAIVVLITMLTLTACVEDSALSAYDIAVNNGFTGTEAEWLESLKGETAYELAVENGYTGTEEEWLNSLQGIDGIDGEYAAQGLSAYQIAVENGFTGTEAEWLDSLKGESGSAGASSAAYAANIAINSVVSVYCEFTGMRQIFPGSEPQEYTFSGAGAGVIYSDDKESGDAI